jgi:hypothetical protein
MIIARARSGEYAGCGIHSKRIFLYHILKFDPLIINIKLYLYTRFLKVLFNVFLIRILKTYSYTLLKDYPQKLDLKITLNSYR